jgi:hypothetical protein
MKKKWKFWLIATCLLFLMIPSWTFAWSLDPEIECGFKAMDNLRDRSTFHGFLQQGVSFNTQNLIETPDNDKWDTQMIRSTAYGEIQTDMDWSIWTVIYRYDLEKESLTVQNIQKLREANGATDDLTKDIYTQFDFREWYNDIRVADRFLFRTGKQQVVWGNTDFFSGLDIVHGYDNSWRSFLEAPNEQRRKPLIMENITAEVPEFDGSLQAIFRPGWDRDSDIGNTYDIFGGRWAQQPNKGFDFFANDTITYDLDHPEGKQQDPTYGVRWQGLIGGLDYSFCYLRSFNNDPVVNPSEATLGALGAHYYKVAPRGTLGDFIFKQVDITGLTLNYYVAPLDIVARTEMSYSWGVPYNKGTDFAGGTLPGFEGVKTKDVIRMMFNFDRNVNFAKWMFGACRPGFLSLQVFDSWVMDYDEDEDLCFQAGYSKELKEHETIGTAILSWNYYYDRVTPQFAYGYDITNGGSFFIPSLSFTYGDHWRLMFEYDMFFGGLNGKDPGEIEDNHALLDGLENNDQFYVRLQYQF